jgi:hypothetical protein
MNGNGDYSNAIASAIDTKRRDSIELLNVTSTELSLLEARVGSTDTFSAKQSVAITDVKQTIRSFHSQTAQFNPFGAIDNQPCLRNNNLFESNNSSLATEQCIRQFGGFVNGSSCATNVVVATAAECERGPSLHDDQVVVLSYLMTSRSKMFLLQILSIILRQISFCQLQP